MHVADDRGDRRLGAIGVGTDHVDAYDAADVRFLKQVAKLIALAVDNAVTHKLLGEERERLRALVEVNRTLGRAWRCGRCCRRFPNA